MTKLQGPRRRPYKREFGELDVWFVGVDTIIAVSNTHFRHFQMFDMGSEKNRYNRRRFKNFRRKVQSGAINNMVDLINESGKYRVDRTTVDGTIFALLRIPEAQYG